MVALKEAFRLRRAIYDTSDGEGRLNVTYMPCPTDCWDHTTQRNILLALISLTNGVVEKDGEAVSASCNLGRVYEEDHKLYIEDMLRCDTARQEQAILAQHAAVASAGGLHRYMAGYHSWRHSAESTLAATAARVYHAQNGAPMQLKKRRWASNPPIFRRRRRSWK